MTTVRAAISQTTWTGDKESMLDKHERVRAGCRGPDGAQAMCFQELFYGPYFGITQDKKYYRYAEPADGPIVQRFASIAKELGIVTILPIYEEDQTGVYYNTTVVVDADGTSSASTARSTSRTSRGSGRSSTSAPATSATRCSTPRSARSARTSATTGTSPRGGASRPSRRAHRVQPERDQARPLEPPVGGGGARGGRRQRLLRAAAEPRRARRQRVRRRGGRTSTARAT